MTAKPNYTVCVGVDDGVDCTLEGVYEAETIFIYPLGAPPLTGKPNKSIRVCMRHKNDKDIDAVMIEESIKIAQAQVPTLVFGDEKGEVYWRLL